jgi:hypothetical protein
MARKKLYKERYTVQSTPEQIAEVRKFAKDLFNYETKKNEKRD